MAKPERHHWPYGPHWNYYPPHVLNLPKIPLSSGQQIHSDPNENYSPIRCPEPRRPYQVAYQAFGSYCHQNNHTVGPYVQPSTFYHPKQYVHKPVPHDNFNNPYKLSENVQSYPACSSNFHITKDQNSCYQNSWNNTSHYQRKPPELDVRRFLATWQEKDDDFIDLPSENEERRVDCQVFDSVPLDCSKRNITEKNMKRHYEQFSNGQVSNTNGCVVQPYYVKDNNNLSLNRGVTSNVELNNNIPQRSNLNYSAVAPHEYHTKKYCSHTEYWKATGDKLLSTEHSDTYIPHISNCNDNYMRHSVNFRKQKDNLLETSQRSHYNLSSSLESGDLFCDINSKTEDHQKQPIIHPIFNDGHHRETSCDQSSYFDNSNNNNSSNFSENLVYADLSSMKDSWELFPNSAKCRDIVRTNEKQNMPSGKVHSHSQYEQPTSNANNGSNPSVMYEGAFNILPSLNEPKLNITNSIQYSNSNSLLVNTNDSTKTTLTTEALTPSKTTSNITKCSQSNSKIKPYQFNEEISSEDIDISIASSGDLVVEDDHTTVGPISVINFSRTKKDKIATDLTKSDKEHESVNHSDEYSVPLFANNLEKSPSIPAKTTDLAENTLVESVLNDTENKSDDMEDKVSCENLSPKHYLTTSDEAKKMNVVDLTVFKSQHLDETINVCDKQEINYLGISNNYFENSDFENNSKPDFHDNVINQNSSPHENDCDKSVISILKSEEISCSTNNDNECQVMDKLAPQSSSLESHNCSEKTNQFITNDNLLLLAHCSQEYGCQIAGDLQDSPECSLERSNSIQKEAEETQKNLLTKVFDSQISKISCASLECSGDSDDKIIVAPDNLQTNSLEGNDEAEKNKTDSKCSSKESSCQLENTNSIENNGFNRDETKQHGALYIVSKECDTESVIQVKNVQKCSQEFGCQIAKEIEDSQKCVLENDGQEKEVKPIRDTVIKCSLRWDKIFNVMPNENNIQPDMSLDLGPAKVELRMPSESYSTGQWKIIEADNKIQTSSIVQVKRLILKRKSQSEERIPKMVIKKTEGQEYRSYLKNEPNDAVLNCEKYKIFYDAPSKSKLLKNSQTSES